MARRRSGPPRVALVTDSTASLSCDWVAEHEVTVVPLQVVIGGTAYDEGVPGGVTAETLAEALKAWTPVSTSRPNPEAFLAIYKALAKDHDQIVSVHISGELSGTFESAQLAAAQAPIPVHAVDSRQVGMGTGFAVMAAQQARAAGLDGEAIAHAARKQGDATTTLLYVDTLEYLRRGGRVGATAALLGSALAVKPILAIEEGRITPRERVRTATKALARLQELAVAADAGRPARVAVAHLANPDRASNLAAGLSSALHDQIVGEISVGEIGAVLGAHVGPGMVAVCVAPVSTS
ncbi:MAG: DegV family protein [Marmoricola sp.]